MLRGIVFKMPQVLLPKCRVDVARLLICCRRQPTKLQTVSLCIDFESSVSCCPDGDGVADCWLQLQAAEFPQNKGYLTLSQKGHQQFVSLTRTTGLVLR